MRDKQWANADCPMSITESPNSMLSSALQLSNTCSGNTVIDLLKFAAFRESHMKKAAIPIVETESGMLIDCKAVQFVNAPSYIHMVPI